jgi:hypothetical protein
MENLLQQLIDLVKSAAPALWEIALRQVQVRVVIDIIWLIGMLAAAVGLAIALRGGFRKYQSQEHNIYSDDFGLWMLLIFEGVAELVLLGITISLITEIISYSMNPNYYAIQVLLNAAK